MRSTNGPIYEGHIRDMEDKSSDPGGIEFYSFLCFRLGSATSRSIRVMSDGKLLLCRDEQILMGFCCWRISRRLYLYPRDGGIWIYRFQRRALLFLTIRLGLAATYRILWTSAFARLASCAGFVHTGWLDWIYPCFMYSTVAVD
ncbi:hypothetical protein F4860DRAFT_187420 [Xylaria cubensis]|nr:hypothetical protein F4860DRAFT_187420 [Xylaria cubensis]